MQGAVLTRENILNLLSQEPPLVAHMPQPQEQLQPNGVDLTVRDIAVISSWGQMGVLENDRVLAQTTPLTFDGQDFILLQPGAYMVTFNEVVNLPSNVMALGRTRSSLLRCGVALHTAVWDAGYSGRSQSLLVVYNPQGFRLARNARIMQLVFFALADFVAEGYQGRFQFENL